MANYRPGELDQRITIERKTRTTDGQGGVTDSWATFATVWAHVRPKSGGETVQADRVEGKASYLFVIRHRSDLREADRIKWQGIAYNIRLLADRSGRSLYLEIDAERGVAQ